MTSFNRGQAYYYCALPLCGISNDTLLCVRYIYDIISEKNKRRKKGKNNMQVKSANTRTHTVDFVFADADLVYTFPLRVTEYP